MDEQRPWHRLFGLSWIDFFRGMPVTVESEKDLSVRKQLLDIVVIRKEPGALICRLPDGFENLASYNLISFKSHQEKLSAWTLEELLGHYVNLRKQVSPSMDEADLFPREEFRLFAVCARFPRNLADDSIALRPIQPGVYEVEVLTRQIRVVVANLLPQVEHNALLHLFSASTELLAYGARHYTVRSWETSSLLDQLFARYEMDATDKPSLEMLKQLHRETVERILRETPIAKRLEGVPVEKRLEGVSVDELLAALSAQDRETLARRLKANGSQSKPE